MSMSSLVFLQANITSSCVPHYLVAFLTFKINTQANKSYHTMRHKLTFLVVFTTSTLLVSVEKVNPLYSE